ncbi:MAG: hypothetical protein A2X82_11825 [Geobacteraceae bacterium GWC2_55_20]|nr:MAG: hypothetical protein A2X82_11825 [Geobacteraceae bacterium GWC2_55_20]OGU26236.1 MAG: hypothetical protein A2X85_00745 [Geobacteraceae bacterium GWF2_54_21]HBA73308.1 hypothetical protein [Geobacter sp.]HCE68211.1 hypothetical protein [Geobacter sp.]
MKLAEHVNQIQLYPTPAFDAGFTRYMPFGGVDKYARFSVATSMENLIKGMHRIEEAIKNLK